MENADIRYSGTQPFNFSHISTAVQNNTYIILIRDFETVAHSLAIGNPTDGYYTKEVILNSGGYVASPSDQEIADAIHLLARTEGIFTEPAGGTTIAGLKILAENGYIDKDERVVGI